MPVSLGFTRTRLVSGWMAQRSVSPAPTPSLAMVSSLFSTISVTRRTWQLMTGWL